MSKPARKRHLRWRAPRHERGKDADSGGVLVRERGVRREHFCQCEPGPPIAREMPGDWESLPPVLKSWETGSQYFLKVWGSADEVEDENSDSELEEDPGHDEQQQIKQQIASSTADLAA